MLLPAYAAHDDPHHELVARALCDHENIRHRAAALAGDTAPSVPVITQLGVDLADHVRLEERELSL